MWIQILLIAGIVLLASVMMRRTGADSHLAIRRLLMLVFALGTILAIMFPQMLTWIARAIGVGRGTDLLLYVLVMVFLASVYTQHRRHVAHQRQLTLLARQVALLDAAQREQRSSGTR
ncbi:DUF2304 domain-containing protein [Microbacterium sp.]|uniref:DUF2304 domain-containing protein n=1 Tax=Microbacterium sp. TaxID=51671 RepID=UPI0033417CF3